MTGQGAGLGTALVEHAPAKINLTLRVLGRRPDGYHELDSLVVFAQAGDRLTFLPGARLALDVSGPFAGAVGAPGDNLVFRAAQALAAQVAGLRVGRFILDKRLPVAAGLGGGSADAAAALRLLARHNGLALDDPRVFAAACATGSDVPVCLAARARVMRGIGDDLGPALDVAAVPAVLVNPGVAVATKEVFARLGLAPGDRHKRWGGADTLRDAGAPRDAGPPREPDALVSFVAERPNDLEAPAVAVAPIIADVLASLRASRDCRLARMSGSGATCFAVFPSDAAAAAAARLLAATHPAWWVCATALGRGETDPLAGGRQHP